MGGINDGSVECGVRDKYAKPWNGKGNEESYFQLYTTYSKPGLVSIFYNEDQRSFHNWGLEVGSGQKKGRIKETIDHQINAPVLEIAGLHDGSVYMVCPPDKDGTINVDMAYVTMLMKDMHGYSSVEFTVLDTLGFSRKICAKNFKSRCTIGELNCEIPMRLSPTWNYACVNLDETLRNAFGTKLVSVQRIKINANVRVRRIYFHDEIIPFKSLPQEFRIKLVLTPQEKQEIHMYEEFLYNEPTTSPERTIPWSMPRLMITKNSAIQSALRMSTANVLQSALRRRVEIMEVPLRENDSDKYTNINGIQAASNSGLLREMLQKSIPPSKILLPTLSLIYPDRKGHEDAAEMRTGKVNEYLKKKGNNKEGKYFGRESFPEKKNTEECGVDEKTEHLRKMKKCIDATSPRFDGQGQGQDENLGAKQENSGQGLTDWERFHFHQDHHGASPSTDGSPRSGSPVSDMLDHQHHHHHHHGGGQHGCGKYTVTDLANYLKHRETFGDYDMFTSKVGNEKFLMGNEGEGEDNFEVDSEEDMGNDDSYDDLNGERKSLHENPFLLHQRGSQSSRKSSRALSFIRRSTVSRFALQDPAKYGEGQGQQGQEIMSAVESGVYNTESWLLTWAYNGVSWARTREINQKLLLDARKYYASEHEYSRKKSIMEAGLSLPKVVVPLKFGRGPQKLPETYRSAVPMLPRVMKEELRGTGGYYDVIVDNPTLPIDHY